jgi:hypothetical protein
VRVPSLLLVLLASLNCLVQIRARADEPAGRWSTLAPMNAPHECHAAVAGTEKVYAVGGTGSVTLEEYDPKTNLWKVRPAIPTPRDFLGVAAVGNQIIAVGGLTRGRNALGTAESFDTERRVWTAVSGLSVPRNRLAAVTVAGEVYALGGMTDRGNSAAVEVYDPRLNRWSKRADMLMARHGHCAVAVGSKLLVMGGYNNEGPTASVEEYDPAKERWTKRTPMPTPRGFFGAGVVEGRVYAVAGRVRGQPPVERYDPRADIWERLDPMPGALRDRFGTAVLGNKIYVIGGEFQGDRALPRSVLCFDPSRF